MNPNHLRSLALVVALLTLPAYADHCKDGFVSLFDGKTLKGWVTASGAHFRIGSWGRRRNLSPATSK